ncbi:MAG: hypothetical protein ACK559_36810, partial [bacterium]
HAVPQEEHDRQGGDHRLAVLVDPDVLLLVVQLSDAGLDRGDQRAHRPWHAVHRLDMAERGERDGVGEHALNDLDGGSVGHPQPAVDRQRGQILPVDGRRDCWHGGSLSRFGRSRP